MPKPNRGNTIKLSVRLSTTARQNIEKAKKNLGVSSAGVILFELTKLLDNPPSVSELERLEEEITLERDHFVFSVNDHLHKRITALSEDLDMKKNRLIGYMVSNYFENLDDLQEAEETDSKQIKIQVNESLKKKMMEYSEKNFIPVSAIISYAVLHGPSEKLPTFDTSNQETMFTNVPAYIDEMIKEGAAERNLRENFYTALCIYKQCMTEDGRFF